MQEYTIRKTQFAVTDFLSWQRAGTINLNPPFQRRSVWKPDAKSYFMDTVVKGLPAPIIYLRQRVDLKTQKSSREVVDGQQRLRTIFGFIDPAILPDYDSERDGFTVRENHNTDLAGKTFQKLSERLRSRILAYEFSVHVLPPEVEDQEVLEMFARLNATGTKLNHQELRNADWFGEFKTSMYRLAFEQLERWRAWKIFTDDQISRMREVEMTSDLAMSMINGLSGKSQKRLDNIYEEYDDTFDGQKELESRFRLTMDELDSALGSQIGGTVYASEVHFFSLFVYVYDVIWGLGSALKRKTAKKLPKNLPQRLLSVGEKFSDESVPKNVLDAVRRASADYGRRRTRLNFIKQQCHA
jgi:uncharacterized protein with ParB-like and HNH nuclease domain